MLLFHVLFIFLKIHMNILVLFILTSSFAYGKGLCCFQRQGLTL